MLQQSRPWLLITDSLHSRHGVVIFMTLYDDTSAIFLPWRRGCDDPQRDRRARRRVSCGNDNWDTFAEDCCQVGESMPPRCTKELRILGRIEWAHLSRITKTVADRRGVSSQDISGTRTGQTRLAFPSSTILTREW